MKNKEKWIDRHPGIAFAGMGAVTVALGVGLTSLVAPIQREARRKDTDKVWLKDIYAGSYARSGYLEDTNSPPDGIPDRRVYINMAPSTAWKSYEKCTPEDVGYFQEYQARGD